MSPALIVVTALAWADPGLHPPPRLPDRWAYDAVWMGAAWEIQAPGTVSEVGSLWDAPVALDLAVRNVSDGPALRGTGVNHRVRLSRDETGRTVVDELSLQARFTGVAIRPAMGDRLDLSLLGGRWDQNVLGLARPWGHLQVFVPMHLVGVGFSDTDADDDVALRYYAAAGLGIGADWMFRVAGPVGLHVRVEGAADTLHRLRREERDQVRHEVWARAEGDLVLVDAEMPFTFGAWAEQRTQWEPRDAPDGVDRQVIAGGMRFGIRLFRGSRLLGEGPDPWQVGPEAPFPGPHGDPGNARATARAEKRHGRNNGRNEKFLGLPDEEAPVEEAPPWPPTPEEHEANNAANE